MKNLKKLFLGVFLFMAVISVTGCGTKKAITADTFKTKMETKKYVVQDASSQFESNEQIKKVFLALNSASSYQIEFYEIDTVDNAVEFYTNNKLIFQQSKSSGNIETNVDLKNNSKYTLESNGMYKLISRIDKTVIYVNTSSKNKKEINKVVKELGY